jgi:hypothetical protein
MRLADSDDPPFLELTGPTQLYGLHAVTTATGRPILVLPQRAGNDRIEFVDALDASAVGHIALGDWTTNSGDLRTRVADHHGVPVLFGGFEHQPLRLWSIPDGRLLGEWRPKDPWRAIDLSVRGDAAVAALAVDDTVHQLDAVTGAPAGPHLRAGERTGLLRRRPTVQIWCLAVIGPHVIAGDRDGTLWRWDAKTGEQTAVWPRVHRGPIVRISAWSVAGRTVLATVGSDSTAHWLDADTGDRIATAALLNDMPRPLALPDGTLLVAGDARIQAFDALTGDTRDDLARWILDDGVPAEDQPMVEEICAADVYGTPMLFAATLLTVWRLPTQP